MQSASDSIQNLYEFCTFNNANIKDYNLYYSKLLKLIENFVSDDLKLNKSIQNYDKNILVNITYENLIIKKIKTKLAKYKGIIGSGDNPHIAFLDNLLKLLVKSYFIYKYNNIVYERILLEMIYLIFMNKDNDNKTPLLNYEITKYLIDRNGLVKNILLQGIDSSYRDISSLSINFAKTYKHVLFEGSVNNLKDIVENNDTDVSTKERLIQIFKTADDVDHFQQYFIKNIELLIKEIDSTNEEVSFKTMNDELILLRNFISKDEQSISALFSLVQKVVDSIKLYITGDPNIDLTNEYKIIISYKIYSTVIDIITKNLKIVDIDYIHDLLLTLSNSACIHITVPLYKTLLKSLDDPRDEQKLKYFKNLNDVLSKYHHFGRRFGAVPYMYQQLFSTSTPNSTYMTYENYEYTALNFEIKLAILPHLSDFKRELQWVFDYQPQNDYVMDTYIVRLVTGIINYTLTKLKFKNYKLFKESMQVTVEWINSGDNYDKMLLGVLAQLVKNKSFVTRIDVDWKKLSHDKNWLIRKTAAELFYVCNTRNFDVGKYVDGIVKDGENDDNSMQYHLFVIDCYSSDNTRKNIDADAVVNFYDEVVLKNMYNKYLHLQVFKNINNCEEIRLHYNQMDVFDKCVDIISQQRCGINELIVKELVDIYTTRLLPNVIKSLEYYEIAVDFLLKTDLTIEFTSLIPDLCQLYTNEKYDFIKLKIVKVFEKHTQFNIDYLKQFALQDKESKNFDLKQECEILDLNNYWTFFSDEDETKRLISLKKAIVNKDYLKMYHFENDNDSSLISDMYKSLGLPSFATTIKSLNAEDVKKELKEILEICLEDLKDEYEAKTVTTENSTSLFEVDNFHNISNLWWYVYLLTSNNNVIEIDITNENADLLNTVEHISAASNKVDVTLLMISRIMGYENFKTSLYQQITSQLR